MRWLLYPILAILTSFYIFPIKFYFFPAANTKMIMAVLGVAAFVINSITKRQPLIRQSTMSVAICAFMVSFWGIVSVLYNNTNDFSYATYFVSFCVWIAAAYFVVTCIRVVHKRVSVDIVCNYLIAVAIGQCVLAVVLDRVPSFTNIVNNIVVGFGSMHSAGEGLKEAGRLYGIGAALDVAGTRFCAILSMISIMSYEMYKLNKYRYQILYFILLVVLLVIGSMISRTTGVGMAFVALFYAYKFRGSENKTFILQLVGIIAGLSLLLVLLYNTSPFFYENLRFAFEGFFNLAETGQWRLTSTDALKDMYVLPESLRTWIIGDGYFKEPYSNDPYYVGEARDWGSFYMGTDAGYLRFIYYFGCLGLSAFLFYFIKNTTICVNRYPNNRWVFYALLLMNCIIWIKVATDIFCLFALFLCIPQEDNDAYENEKSESIMSQIKIDAK